MYILKDKNEDIFSTRKGEQIVFIRLKDACFFVDCIREPMDIARIIFLPHKSILCKLEEIKRND